MRTIIGISVRGHFNRKNWNYGGVLHKKEYDDSKTSCIREQLDIAYRGPYHIETSPLICRANRWIGFYLIETSGMKG